MTESLAPETDLPVPQRFTQDVLGWVPWLEPLREADLGERHFEALVQRSRAKNAYFRLLARDPAVLRARTLADFDIFFNVAEGLPRADREIAATAASRGNGCVYCASVHAGFAAHHSGRRDDVQRLLEGGTGARIDPRWDAVVDASVALSQSPPALGSDELRALDAAGLDDLEVLDTIMSAAFFNWANRLMLSLGEPTL